MSNDSARQHLIGTWKLIAAVREEVSSGTKTEFPGTEAGQPQDAAKTALQIRYLLKNLGEAAGRPAPCPHSVRREACNNWAGARAARPRT